MPGFDVILNQTFSRLCLQSPKESLHQKITSCDLIDIALTADEKLYLGDGTFFGVIRAIAMAIVTLGVKTFDTACDYYDSKKDQELAFLNEIAHLVNKLDITHSEKLELIQILKTLNRAEFILFQQVQDNLKSHLTTDIHRYFKSPHDQSHRDEECIHENKNGEYRIIAHWGGVDLIHTNTRIRLMEKSDLLIYFIANAKQREAHNQQNAYLVGQDIPDVNLSHFNLSYSNLESSKLCYTNLKNTNLNKVNFTDTKLMGVRMEDSHIENAIFTGSTLAEVNLNGALGHGANFSSATLSNVTMTGADFNEECKERAFQVEQDERTVSFSTNFGHTTLTNVNLEKANVSETNFADATLTQVNLNGANGCGANFDGTTLTNVTFLGANLSQTFGLDTERNTIPLRTNFSNAKLTNVDLSKADARDANFTGASLNDVTILGANFKGALFEGTTVRLALPEWTEEALKNYFKPDEGGLNILDTIKTISDAYHPLKEQLVAQLIESLKLSPFSSNVLKQMKTRSGYESIAPLLASSDSKEKLIQPIAPQDAEDEEIGDLLYDFFTDSSEYLKTAENKRMAKLLESSNYTSMDSLQPSSESLEQVITSEHIESSSPLYDGKNKDIRIKLFEFLTENPKYLEKSQELTILNEYVRTEEAASPNRKPDPQYERLTKLSPTIVIDTRSEIPPVDSDRWFEDMIRKKHIEGAYELIGEGDRTDKFWIV